MAKQDLISTHMSMSTLQGSSKFETTNDPKSISINIPMPCNMLIKLSKIVTRISWNVKWNILKVLIISTFDLIDVNFLSFFKKK